MHSTFDPRTNSHTKSRSSMNSELGKSTKEHPQHLSTALENIALIPLVSSFTTAISLTTQTRLAQHSLLSLQFGLLSLRAGTAEPAVTAVVDL